MILAISTGLSILALIGLALGLVAAIVVVNLFTNIVRSATEIESYAEEILAAGVAIAENLDGVEGLGKTRDLANATPGLAGSYLAQVRGGPRP